MEKEKGTPLDQVADLLGKQLKHMNPAIERLGNMMDQLKTHLEPKEKKIIFVNRNEATVDLMPDGSLIFRFKDPKAGEAYFKRLK